MSFVKESLSAGRVQSAALKIIIDRERKRSKFKQATYYGLTSELITLDQETFSARLYNLDSKRIARGRDFDQESGELTKNNLIALRKSQAKAHVKELKSGP